MTPDAHIHNYNACTMYMWQKQFPARITVPHVAAAVRCGYHRITSSINARMQLSCSCRTICEALAALQHLMLLLCTPNLILCNTLQPGFAVENSATLQPQTATTCCSCIAAADSQQPANGKQQQQQPRDPTCPYPLLLLWRGSGRQCA
jgi:hypothetical protein